ncbi:zinc-binding dehydrogenase [Peribacillus frigoritolerans]
MFNFHHVKKEELGATLTIDPTTENAVEIIKGNTNGGVNVSFEASGVHSKFDSAFASVKPRGEVLIIALWEKPTIQLLKRKTN